MYWYVHRVTAKGHISQRNRVHQQIDKSIIFLDTCFQSCEVSIPCCVENGCFEIHNGSVWYANIHNKQISLQQQHFLLNIIIENALFHEISSNQNCLFQNTPTQHFALLNSCKATHDTSGWADGRRSTNRADLRILSKTYKSKYDTGYY